MISFTADIHSGVSGHVETVALIFKKAAKISLWR